LNAHAPERGLYLLLDFTAYRQPLKDIGLSTDTEICTRVLEDTGAVLLPSKSLGLPTEALCARLAYVDFDGKQALDDICMGNWSEAVTYKHTKNVKRHRKPRALFKTDRARKLMSGLFLLYPSAVV
jgi:hypothetical protein